jgi:cytoskeleton protein RodZ
MTSIGDTLRRERQSRNLELPKIAGELKISARFLEAMEQDDFAKLPGGVFTKSFLRQYAVFLGFDGDEVVAGMEHAVEPEANGSHLQLVDKPKPDVPGIDLEMGEENWQSVRERRAPLPSWFRAGLLLVVLMLTCSGVYWWWQRPRHQVLAREMPPTPKASPATQPAPPVSRPAEPPPAPSDSSTAVLSAATPQASNEPASNEQSSNQQPAKPAPAESAPAPPAATPAIPVAPPNPNATCASGSRLTKMFGCAPT